ncbi:recombinase family protein [Nonomuraea sp. NPDC050536]|uniref:recombinase family protein n=1 Tax=Nonomuraea sp. NPDC050536 TaxID=3364366 RepID=UPI0037C5BABA
MPAKTARCQLVDLGGPDRTAHGRLSAPRPKLDLVLQLPREGDKLKAARLDCLSRSVLHLVTLGADLRARKVGLHVIQPWRTFSFRHTLTPVTSPLCWRSRPFVVLPPCSP